jgi:hypothetical protein
VQGRRLRKDLQVALGSLGDEICADQLLPLRDPKADVAYEEIVLRRSNWLEWLLSDL